MRSVEVVQQMIDWMEENMDELPTLQKVSAAVGYSPWYCSCMFHDVTGMTMKSYIAGRKLERITEEIRDTRERRLSGTHIKAENLWGKIITEESCRHSEIIWPLAECRRQ